MLVSSNCWVNEQMLRAVVFAAAASPYWRRVELGWSRFSTHLVAVCLRHLPIWFSYSIGCLIRGQTGSLLVHSLFGQLWLVAAGCGRGFTRLYETLALTLPFSLVSHAVSFSRILHRAPPVQSLGTVKWFQWIRTVTSDIIWTFQVKHAGISQLDTSDATTVTVDT